VVNGITVHAESGDPDEIATAVSRRIRAAMRERTIS
jgi:hypothetical protein